MNSIIYYLFFLLKVSFTTSQNSSYQPSSFFYPVLYEEPSSPSFYYTNRSLDTVITIINACFNDFFMQNRTIKGSDYQIKIFEENSNEYNNDLISDINFTECFNIIREQYLYEDKFLIVRVIDDRKNSSYIDIDFSLFSINGPKMLYSECSSLLFTVVSKVKNDEQKIKIQKMINEVKDKYNRTIPDLILIYNDICYSIENNLTQFRMYTKTINYDLCGENCLFDSFDEINDMLYCKCKLKKISSRVSLYKEVDIKERDIRKCSNFKLEFSISLQVIILSLLFYLTILYYIFFLFDYFYIRKKINVFSLMRGYIRSLLTFHRKYSILIINMLTCVFFHYTIFVWIYIEKIDYQKNEDYLAVIFVTLIGDLCCFVIIAMFYIGIKECNCCFALMFICESIPVYLGYCFIIEKIKRSHLASGLSMIGLGGFMLVLNEAVIWIIYYKGYFEKAIQVENYDRLPVEIEVINRCH